MGFLLDLFKKLFNFPDLGEIGKGFSSSVHERLKKLEHKLLWYFIIHTLVTVLGFAFVYGCLESGFHWKYLLQV